ncbi:MAG: hypothetical protein VYA60_05205 [Pseudomonadota bacterium]|nr:hypothetical protein [Pseudomonadota bacterium]
MGNNASEINKYWNAIASGKKSSVSLELMKKITESVGANQVVDTVEMPHLYPCHTNHIDFYQANRFEIQSWIANQSTAANEDLQDFIFDMTEEACINVTQDDINDCSMNDNQENPHYSDIVLCLVDAVTFAFLNDLQDFLMKKNVGVERKNKKQHKKRTHKIRAGKRTHKSLNY